MIYIYQCACGRLCVEILVIRYFMVGDMAGCLASQLSSTPDELVKAYTGDKRRVLQSQRSGNDQ